MGLYSQLDHWELGRKHNQFMESFGRIQQAVESRRWENRHLIKPADWRWGGRAIGMEAASLVAGELGFNSYNIHAFVVDVMPGGSEGAYHIHGEAVKFYLSGHAREIIGEREYEVGPGDAVLVPAHVWHGTQNPYPEKVRFLAVAHAGAGAPMFRQPIFRTRDDLRSSEEEAELEHELAQGGFGAMQGGQLGRVRHHLLQALGEMESEMEERRVPQRHLIRQSELEWADLSVETGRPSAGPSPRIAKAICPELGFPAYNFFTYFLDVPPGAESPTHRHGEEVKYFLQGRGTETIGDKTYEVEAGDLIFVPARTQHATRNSGSEPLRFFSISQARGTPIAVPAYLDMGSSPA